MRNKKPRKKLDRGEREYLRMRMRLARIGTNDLAEVCELAPSTVSCYLSGTIAPTIEFLATAERMISEREGRASAI